MIVAGFGFRASATLESLRDAYAQASTRFSADTLATLSDKAENPAFVALARELHLSIRPVTAGQTSVIETKTTSTASLAERGTGSVAEASALAAAGEDARLVQSRAISRDRLATCALAMSADEGETE